MSRNISFRVALLAALSFLLAPAAYSQTFGAITGEVKDTSGAAVAGAQILVRNTATNATRTVTTNEEGVYSIPALNPGVYDVRAERQGFNPAKVVKTPQGVEAGKGSAMPTS